MGEGPGMRETKHNLKYIFTNSHGYPGNAAMKKLFILAITMIFLVGIIDVDAPANDPLNIKISNVRHAYYRNEDVTFEVLARNSTNDAIKGLKVTVSMDHLKPLEKKLTLSAGETKTISYPVKCTLLKPGNYRLEISTINGAETAHESFPVYISQPPNPQRLPVYYWGGSAGMMDWGQEHGFNTFAVGSIRRPLTDESSTARGYRELFDKAVRNRINLGIYFYIVDAGSYENHPGVFSVPRKGKKDEETIDNQRPNKICLREPYVRKYTDKVIHANMNIFGIYPSFYHSLINSEFRNDPCYSENCRNILKEETGLDLYDYDVDPLHPPMSEEEAMKAGLPENLARAVPVGGIIEDDNPYYRYYMWWWKRGMGDALLNERISDIIKEHQPDVITWHDPFRLAPVYGRHKGLDCIGQWTYTHPDPKYTAYIETLITSAGPEKQMVMPDITTWEYQNWLAPTDSGVVIIPRHILRENCWIALSRRPNIICHYIAGRFNPLRPYDTWRRDPRTFEMMTWMSENVYKPYGPLILQMERTPRKAAILCSAASVLFPEISRGGWPNKAIYPFYSLLMMAHIPADVIFDETITRYGLDQYDILFLHQSETITRSVYEKILDFKKRGGFVIGDRLLRADIPLDYRCEFDLDHRKRQLADLVLKGEGVTADEDRKIMTRYVLELRRVLNGKVDRYVDSNSPEVIFNVLESGPVKYIFMINDRRTYGERFGRWKTFHEKGVEQVVTALVRAEGKTPILYDIRKHREIPAERTGDTLHFTRKLGPCDGTIVAVYPSPIKKVIVKCPQSIKRGRSGTVTISVVDSNRKSYGSQPLFVRVTDTSGTVTDYSDYYATMGGTYRLEVTPALNDLKGEWTIFVRDLTSGLETSSTFDVR